MYLSRLRIDLRGRDALRLVSSPYRTHAAIEGSFTRDAVRRSDDGRILWRLDPVPGDGQSAWLYVVSPDRPDRACVAHGFSPQWAYDLQTRRYDRLLDYVREGQTWQFRLKANPCYSASVSRGQASKDELEGKRYGHVTVDQQLRWLLDRTAKCGFEIPDGDAGAPMVVVSERRREQYVHRGDLVTVDTATYDGALRVTDADLLRHALGFGIGREKGFGCGLITLARCDGD